MMTYKGYTAEVELDLDAGVLVGRVLDIEDVVMFEAARADEVYKEFTISIDEYLAVCAEQGKEPNQPHSGKFVVRTTSERHGLIARAARESGKSMNTWIEETLVAAAAATLARAPQRERVMLPVR
jgi:predicted HicB family RNase H-like nuclease